jgi:hypothetical protein
MKEMGFMTVAKTKESTGASKDIITAVFIRE